MPRLLALTALIGATGLTLVFSEIRWFRRASFAERLAPYTPGLRPRHGAGVFSVTSLRQVVEPLSQAVGERIARLFGVGEQVDTRLRRIHAEMGAAAFRSRQLARAVGAVLVAALAAIALSLPTPLAMGVVLGAPVLTFLLEEQRLAAASEAWQRRLFLELPVVAEQLAMLTAAGWSLTAALGRIARRGSGNCARDLRRVDLRIRQGLGEVEALREWAAVADVDAVDRLVSVLALNREATDLGRLLAEEARSIRRDAQRELIETIERRNQQVWIPVTVAALVPGVLLMGVPFLDALTLFSAS